MPKLRRPLGLKIKNYCTRYVPEASVEVVEGFSTPRVENWPDFHLDCRFRCQVLGCQLPANASLPRSRVVNKSSFITICNSCEALRNFTLIQLLVNCIKCVEIGQYFCDFVWMFHLQLNFDVVMLLGLQNIVWSFSFNSWNKTRSFLFQF